MKQLAINRGSLILKVARYGGLDDSDQTDLCSVFWCFWWGLVRAPFWVSLFGVIGAAFGFFLVVDPILTLLVWRKTGVLLDPAILCLQAAVWTFIVVAAYALWCEHSGRRNKLADATSSTASLFRAGYHGWKERTCVLVAVND